MQIEGAIPQSLDFFQNVPIINKYVSKREETFVYPEAANSGYSPQNSIIRFSLSNGMLDLRKSSWEFYATASATGGTYVRFSKGITCTVNRLRVMCGTTVLEDIINFNLLYAAKLLSKDPAFLSTSATVLMGYGDAAARNTDNANPNRRYVVNLGFLSDLLNRVIPQNYMNSQLRIELYMEQAGRCIETDGTNPTYTINNNQFHYSLLKTTSEFDNLIQFPILISYKSWENYVNQYAASTNNSQTIIPIKKRQMTGIFSVSRNQTDTNNPASNDKFQTYQLYSQFGNSRYKINNTYFPLDKVEDTYDSYIQMVDFWRVKYNQPIQYGNSWPTSFINAQNICQRTSADEADDYICGIDTSKDTSSVVSEITFNSGVPALQEVQYYAQYYNVITINGDKSVVLFD